MCDDIIGEETWIRIELEDIGRFNCIHEGKERSKLSLERKPATAGHREASKVVTKWHGR